MIQSSSVPTDLCARSFLSEPEPVGITPCRSQNGMPCRSRGSLHAGYPRSMRTSKHFKAGLSLDSPFIRLRIAPVRVADDLRTHSFYSCTDFKADLGATLRVRCLSYPDRPAGAGGLAVRIHAQNVYAPRMKIMGWAWTLWTSYAPRMAFMSHAGRSRVRSRTLR